MSKEQTPKPPMTNEEIRDILLAMIDLILKEDKKPKDKWYNKKSPS